MSALIWKFFSLDRILCALFTQLYFCCRFFFFFFFFLYFTSSSFATSFLLFFFYFGVFWTNWTLKVIYFIFWHFIFYCFHFHWLLIVYIPYTHRNIQNACRHIRYTSVLALFFFFYYFSLLLLQSVWLRLHPSRSFNSIQHHPVISLSSVHIEDTIGMYLRLEKSDKQEKSEFFPLSLSLLTYCFLLIFPASSCSSLLHVLIVFSTLKLMRALTEAMWHFVTTFSPTFWILLSD